jgi:hypothetical protein
MIDRSDQFCGLDRVALNDEAYSGADLQGLGTPAVSPAITSERMRRRVLSPNPDFCMFVEAERRPEETRRQSHRQVAFAQVEFATDSPLE